LIDSFVCTGIERVTQSTELLLTKFMSCFSIIKEAKLSSGVVFWPCF